MIAEMQNSKFKMQTLLRDVATRQVATAFCLHFALCLLHWGGQP